MIRNVFHDERKRKREKWRGRKNEKKE